MAPTILIQVLAIALPVLVAAEADYDAYRRAKKKDPTATFDGWILAFRVLKAVAIGLTAAAGAPAAIEAVK